MTKDCKIPTQRIPGTCFGCGETGHCRNTCPKDKNKGAETQNNGARGRVYNLRGREAREDPNVVTGTFLLNNHYASVLFDSGAD